VTKFLLVLHLVFAIFAVGPLVHAATTASRGIRRADATATASSARMLRIYAIASVLVVGTGGWLMTRTFVEPSAPDVEPTTVAIANFTAPPYNPHYGAFDETWIWLSLLLWVVAVAIVLALLVPTLHRVAKAIDNGRSAASLTGRVAAGGGLVGLIFVAITVLMVYRPGGR